MGPLHWLTAAELADHYRSRELGPVEVTQHTISRIKELDDRLFAFARLFLDEAKRDAERLERELSEGVDRGPLHGIPVALKDLCSVEGHPAAAGTTVLAERPAERDATVVAKLREAGAIIVGSAAMTEGAYTAHHPTIEPPRNPYDTDRWTGISSSGSGVAVAAGLVVGALGTDTGGSIRFPSAAGGLVGIKPTYGRVSRAGVVPLSMTLDHVGPICRTVRDAAHMLSAIAGPDPADPTAVSDAPPDYAARIDTEPHGLRLGVDEAYIRDHADPQVAEAVLAAIPTFEEAGVSIVEVTLPDPNAVVLPWMTICGADALTLHREFFPERREEYGPAFAEILDFGLAATAVGMAEATEAARNYSGTLAAVFDSVDAFLCPALGAPVPEKNPDFGDLEFLAKLLPFTSPFNVSGSPTITLPCARDDNGMPVALQLVGRHFTESDLCRLARAYESRHAWTEDHPNV